MVSSMRILGLRLLWLRFFVSFRVLWVVVCGMLCGGVVGGRSASPRRCGALLSQSDLAMNWRNEFVNEWVANRYHGKCMGSW